MQVFVLIIMRALHHSISNLTKARNVEAHIRVVLTIKEGFDFIQPWFCRNAERLLTVLPQ